MLTAHDAEDRTRQLEGAVLDAREHVAAASEQYGTGPFQGSKVAGETLHSAQAELINRQADLISGLRDLVRQAVSR